MKKIKKVVIEKFWSEKTVTINFSKDINFLIGANGSGKTTIINLIAASLNADFTTLDKISFRKIRIDFFSPVAKKIYIEVEKTEQKHSPFSNIMFKIKGADDKEAIKFRLDELEEEALLRFYPKTYPSINFRSGQVEKDIHTALKNIVNLTWLSVHRSTPIANRIHDEKNFDSSIDQKIKELSNDLLKYFSSLDRRYSLETEKFQKNFFLSLIQNETNHDILSIAHELDSEQEKDSLRQIFLLLKLKESDFSTKLDEHFTSFEIAKDTLNKKSSLNLDQFANLVSTRRIHTIVGEWNELNEKKININKPKTTFLEEINKLLQRKIIFINDKNELLVETQSGKIFPLIHLSSGEKQLLIILGQSLLQENIDHIYIADEPELSLHVEWQEKLVEILQSLNPNSQIIFATHSPDIVSEFSSSIINVEDTIV